MKICFRILVLSIFIALAGLPDEAGSQALALGGDASTEAPTVPSRTLVSDYSRPTQKLMVDNYLFDAYGPYPISGAAVAAGINQFNNAPPEWGQGMAGFGKRFGSDFAIAAIGTTARYGLAEVLKEDTLYYRCECRGLLPRMSHAVISTVTARRGPDGHRVFSFSALAAPYAGASAAIYGWYPNRFGAKDALRLGSYNLLFYAGGNVALEFFYSGPHSLLSRMHLNNTHGSLDPGPNH
jgi:hypothetical protein